MQELFLNITQRFRCLRFEMDGEFPELFRSGKNRVHVSRRAMLNGTRLTRLFAALCFNLLQTRVYTRRTHFQCLLFLQWNPSQNVLLRVLSCFFFVRNRYSLLSIVARVLACNTWSATVKIVREETELDVVLHRCINHYTFLKNIARNFHNFS